MTNEAAARVAQPTTGTSPNLGGLENPTPQESPKLTLVKGERTEANAWLAEIRSRAEKHLDTMKPGPSRCTDRAVFKVVSGLCSCNRERLCIASIGYLADELDKSRSTITRSLSRWEARGVFEAARRKGGRASQSARGRFSLLFLPALENDSPKQVKMTRGSKRSERKEGLERSSSVVPVRDSAAGALFSPLTVRGGAQSRGIPAATDDKPKKAIFSRSNEVPSQEQNTAPTFKRPQQVKKLFALQRKLGYEASDEQARVFDDLDQFGKKRIIDKLEAEEQRRAIRGEVANPPPKPPAPRHTLVDRPAPTPTRERTACGEGQHRWTAPASDGVSQCNACGEERGELRVSGA